MRADPHQFPPSELPLKDPAQVGVAAGFRLEGGRVKSVFRKEGLARLVFAAEDADRGGRVDAFGPDDGEEEVVGAPLKNGIQPAPFDQVRENVGLQVGVVNQSS